jgi:hypothetical protein
MSFYFHLRYVISLKALNEQKKEKQLVFFLFTYKNEIKKNDKFTEVKQKVKRKEQNVFAI